MIFNYRSMDHWPSLTWLAECSLNNETTQIHHGTGVETRKDWFCEAVWDGEFPAGDFDKTDIVAGSGSRIRDGKLCFVSSGSNVDGLYSLKKKNTTVVSNSLICLLAWVGGNPDIDYLAYSRNFSDYRNTVFGAHSLFFPSTAGQVKMTYFADLLWDGDSLVEQDKPCKDRNFSTFDDYREFLQSSMQRIAENACHEERRHRFKPLCALSNGYDSPTIATLARDLPGIEAFTFKTDRAGTDDSGETIAAALGIPCHVVDRDAWRSVSLAEVPFIACSGSVGDLAFKSAESCLRGSVLLSGPSGDTIWNKNTSLSARMTIGGGSMLGFTEYRLWVGFINCPVPFWGISQIYDVVRLSNSIEMEPWNVGGDYNRPVCRRIVETAGVARALFGVSKRGMSVVPFSRRDFLTPASREDFLAWLEEQRKQHRGKQVSLPNPVLARFLDLNIAFLSACVRVLDKFRYRRGFKWSASLVDFIRARLKRVYYHHHYTVHWAVDRAKRRYRHSSDNEKSESMTP